MTPQRVGDRDLYELAQACRHTAMARAVRRYRGPLERHARGIVKDPQEARDVVQEVFIKAMREPRFFDEEFKVRAWLFRVTTNLCFNLVRDRRRRGGILANMPQESVPQGRTRSTTETVWGAQLRVGVLEAIDALSHDHREILLLRYYQDLSYAEIADELQIRMGTVMSRLSRARVRLGAILGPEHPFLQEAL